jgi:hypothetical protein
MTLPASGYLSDPARTDGEMRAALEDQRDVIATLELEAAAAEPWTNPIRPRLDWVSATQLRLGAGAIPQKIGGVWTLKHHAAVTLSNAGLAANGTYMIYARDVAGVRTLDAVVATGTDHSPDANTGVEIKNGDPTRSLVGFVRVNASSQFVFDLTNIYVLSWYNRRPLQAYAISATPVVAGVGAWQQLGTAINYLAWAGTVLKLSALATVQHTVAGAAAYLGLGSNVVTPVTGYYITQQPAVANYIVPMALAAPLVVGADGAGSVLMAMYTSAASGTYSNYGLYVECSG